MMNSLQATTAAHAALWAGLGHSPEDVKIFIDRLAKLTATELFSVANSPESVRLLFDEVFIPFVHSQLDFLAEDPLAQLIMKLR